MINYVDSLKFDWALVIIKFANFNMFFYLDNADLDFYHAYILSGLILQAPWRELVKGKDSQFLLRVLIWGQSLNWNCSCWRNDMLSELQCYVVL